MNSWKNKNVFITGATGLLGSWLTKSLVDESANVVILVRDIEPKSILWSSSDEFNYLKNKITRVHGKLENFELLERTINEYEIQVVFHLGAQTIVGTANRNALSTFESNIRGTYNLLEACRKMELIEAVVTASSDKAYGEQVLLPYDEAVPVQGTHPYDVSKSCADLISYTYFKTFEVPVCVARCGNFYGPGDLNFNRIVPGTIRSLLSRESPIIRSDGLPIRDYFYVKDGAFAYKLLAEKMLNDKSIHGNAYNFSNETPQSVLQVVKKIIDTMGINIKPTIMNKGKNEIQNQYLSAKKAIQQLGWHAKYDFDTSLKETIEWYTNFLI